MIAEPSGPSTWSDARISERMAEDAQNHHSTGALCLPIEAAGRIVRKVRDDYAQLLNEKEIYLRVVQKGNYRLALFLGAIKDLERYAYIWTTRDAWALNSALDLLQAKDRIAGLEENIMRRAERRAVEMAFVAECLIELEKTSPEVHKQLSEKFNEMMTPGKGMVRP